ncbi:MAG: C25 family cysteine peptidase, partial [candidate division WOR-3 bacterium]|nr:C25 family cysteine peptidase [candidate division WOR-3 bacterium]
MIKRVWIILCFLSVISLIAQDIEYLIITHRSFYDAVLPLADWKDSKGLKTKIVSVSSGLNSSAIRDTIRKYQPTYVLLVGDRQYLPLGKFYPNWTLYQIGTWTDQYYADTSDDGNYFDDVYVGRLPCNSIA